MKLAAFLARTALSAAALFAAGAAMAQDYPNRPITMVVGFPPGGSTDATARILQDPMSTALGQQIVIDNRGGAGGSTAAGQVANAAPDGYTLLLTVNASLTMNKYMQKNYPIDPKKAFEPVALLNDVVLVLAVNSSLPVNSVQELIDYAKKNPGKLSYGSSGVGSGHHICGELLKQKTGIDMVHVPYRGGGPAIQDLVAGQIQVSFGTLPAVMPHVQTGKIRIIAAAEKKRIPELPNTPTIDETIPGVINIGWSGIMAPAGTPKPIVDKLHGVAMDALKQKPVVDKLTLQGLHVMTATPAAFAKMISDEIDYWGKVIPSIGISPE
ncbi:MAG TPA: tripartite tricarboxylate transporter substrate-binding protein [Xanthobacteraceae bacterium]|nr:tripartite tricarboxylate transporter substrate-binding protein [Xanthobacteraceae bacterium]